MTVFFAWDVMRSVGRTRKRLPDRPAALPDNLDPCPRFEAVFRDETVQDGEFLHQVAGHTTAVERRLQRSGPGDRPEFDLLWGNSQGRAAGKGPTTGVGAMKPL